MKLSAGVLAALASVGDAAISCPTSGKDLFEVTCSAATGFKIVINNSCRSSTFPMIDFANSFIYKDATPTKMDTYSGGANTWADITTGATCNDGTSDINPRPKSSGVTDSESANAFGWDIPFSCATKSQTNADAAGNKVLQYDLYWNSQFQDATANNVMYQLGQVKISCKINPYQEDAGTVTITEDTAVDDISNKFVDVAAGLELKVNSFSFESNTPIVESGLSATAIGSSTAITYTSGVSTAKIGDYMELELADVVTSGTASGVLAAFAISIEKCWASTSQKGATWTNPASDPYYADTSTANGAAGEFVFFDNFCPLYPSWVGPGASDGSGYLAETWDQASNLHKVHFRQFGFQSAQSNYAGAGTTPGNEIYYHCFVKICDKTEGATCAKTQLDGSTATTCSATPFAAPSARRRRSNGEQVHVTDVGSAKIQLEVVEDCENREDCFVRSTDANTDKTDDSSAVAATSALAAATMALLI